MKHVPLAVAMAALLWVVCLAFVTDERIGLIEAKVKFMIDAEELREGLY